MPGEKGDFVKLYRKFTNWGWYSDPATKAVFLHILLNANWKDGEYMGVPIKKGECVFGRKAAAEALGLSEQQVRTAIKHLQKSNEISTSKLTNKFSVIKVEKWGFYQGKEDESNQQTNQQLTSKQPATNHIQEGKKGRKKEVCVTRAREGVPFEAQGIINYLNEQTGRSFKANDPSTVLLIEDRLREGYQVSDFLTVIDNKVRHWAGDEKREQFLTPKILFSAEHFADYLAQTPVKGKAGEQPEENRAFDKIAGMLLNGTPYSMLSDPEQELVPYELFEEVYKGRSGLSKKEVADRLKGAVRA